MNENDDGGTIFVFWECFVNWIELYKLWICDYIMNGDNSIYNWLRLLVTNSGCELSLIL